MGLILFVIAIILDSITQGKTGIFTFLYIFIIIFWSIIDSIKSKIEKNKRKEEEIKKLQEFERIFYQEEPKYRNIHDYPPDWLERKYYFNRKYNRTCQKCGRIGGTMHTHHRIPLSKGGDNSEKNLILLCEDCHEEEHRHMLIKRLTILTRVYERARKPYRKEQRLTEVNKIRKKLDLPELVQFKI